MAKLEKKEIMAKLDVLYADFKKATTKQEKIQIKMRIETYSKIFKKLADK